jgi:hypothetical protein
MSAEVVALCAALFNAKGTNEWNLDLTDEQWGQKIFGWPEKHHYNRLITWRREGRLIGLALYALGPLDQIFVWEALPGDPISTDDVLPRLGPPKPGCQAVFFRRLGILREFRNAGRSFAQLAATVVEDAWESGAAEAVMRTITRVTMCRILTSGGLKPVFQSGEFVLFRADLGFLRKALGKYATP